MHQREVVDSVAQQKPLDEPWGFRRDSEIRAPLPELRGEVGQICYGRDVDPRVRHADYQLAAAETQLIDNDVGGSDVPPHLQKSVKADNAQIGAALLYLGCDVRASLEQHADAGQGRHAGGVSALVRSEHADAAVAKKGERRLVESAVARDGKAKINAHI